jgi:four helix bundle protein
MRMVGLRDRTKQFALRVIRLFGALPKDVLSQTIGKQVLRSGTSVAANFREASRARSRLEFIAKLGLVEQELDETILWLELLVESGVFAAQKIDPLKQEAEELLKIMITSIKQSKSQQRKDSTSD